MKKTRGMGCAMRGGGIVGKGAGENKFFRSGSMVNKPVRKLQGGGMAGGIGSLPPQVMQRPPMPQMPQRPMGPRPPLPTQANPAAAAAMARRPAMPTMPMRPGMKKGGRVKGC